MTFEHGREIEMVRRTLSEAGIRVSYKEGGVQVRMGVALFNNSDDIEAVLAVTAGWA